MSVIAASRFRFSWFRLALVGTMACGLMIGVLGLSGSAFAEDGHEGHDHSHEGHDHDDHAPDDHAHDHDNPGGSPWSAVWADRSERDKFLSGLANIEADALVKPAKTSAETWTFLSQAYYWKGDAYGELLTQRADFAKGHDYAMKALRTNLNFERTLIRHPQDIEAALGELGTEYIAAIYWAAKNLYTYGRVEQYDDRFNAQPVGYRRPSCMLCNEGKTCKLCAKMKEEASAETPGDEPAKRGYHRHHNPTETGKVIAHRVEALLLRVLEIDPSYRYGSASALLATFYAERPFCKGGDKKLAAKYFQAALNQSDFFENYVLYARNMCVQENNPVGFEEALNYVLTRQARTLDGMAPEQYLEQEKARKMLSRKDRFFWTISRTLEEAAGKKVSAGS